MATLDKEAASPLEDLVAAGTLPPFHYRGVILNPEHLRYSPQPDIIHPSVIETGPRRISQSPARYFMYYAPHDAPGGICLAYSDDPEKQWHEYAGNPIIACDWSPHHRVSHVSSPHAIWNPEEQRVFLYYHGENDTTRFAVSSAGIHFKYGGKAVDTTMFEPGLTEASYARVFRHRSPSGRGPYVMLLMGNHLGTRNIYIAWSKDGRRWEPERQPFVRPPSGTNQMGPGALFEWNARQYLICFANRDDRPYYDPISDLYLYRVDAELDRAICLGMLMPHHAAGADNLRICDPCLLQTSEQLYLFINVGRRLQQRIALAVADPLTTVTAESGCFIETAASRYVETEPFVDEFEVAEIEGNVELNRSLNRGVKDVKAGRGQFV
jgi:hypothetical protein